MSHKAKCYTEFLSFYLGLPFNRLKNNFVMIIFLKMCYCMCWKQNYKVFIIINYKENYTSLQYIKAKNSNGIEIIQNNPLRLNLKHFFIFRTAFITSYYIYTIHIHWCLYCSKSTKQMTCQKSCVKFCKGWSNYNPPHCSVSS